jgi:nicotinamidase-related amidase
VFTELCVDALARGAYQRGLRVTVVSDGTLPLERDQAEVTSFMARYYDATIADIDAVTRGWSSPGAEGEPTAARAAGEA